MVFVVKAQGQITAVSAKTWIFLMLSGVDVYKRQAIWVRILPMI